MPAYEPPDLGPPWGMAIVGPTATGKTQVSIQIAERLGLEVVCVDPVTATARLDIGTAKPTTQERSRVAHHLLDLIEPGEQMSLHRFQEAASGVARDLEARGARGLVVGGSGLYLRAVLDQLSLPPADPAVRANLQRLPPGELIARLRRLDPASAEFIDPHNARRVIRALEVIEMTGQPFSSFRSGWDHRCEVAMIGLRLPEAILADRIQKRTEEMLDGRWQDECRRLEGSGSRGAAIGSGAIGYGQVFEVLDGRMSLDEALEWIVRATRRLARRQMQWFRRDGRIKWLDANDLDQVTEDAAAYLSGAMALE